MIKKRLGFMLVLAIAFTAMPFSGVLLSAASGDPYVTNGLVARYDGDCNTSGGHNVSSAVWQDISGNGNHVSLAGAVYSHFTDDAFVVDGEQFTFPSGVRDTINSSAFTVELQLGSLVSDGGSFNTFINSTSDDRFALFTRKSNDALEFKSGGNTRPQSSGAGTELARYSTVAITFQNNVACKMYVDGTLISSITPTAAVGTAGELFFGHSSADKSYRAEFRAMRFYSRALTDAEIISNAELDRDIYATLTSPTVPLNIGVPHRLDKIRVYFGETSYRVGSSVAFTSHSSNVVITGSEITVNSAGIHRITASCDGDTRDLWVVAKQTTELDYLVHYDEFMTPLDSGYRLVSGGADRVSVADGQLTLNAQGLEFVRLLLPSRFDVFGDYVIDVRATQTSPQDTARWNAVTYRTQNGNYPYYQMCVRQNATAANGVELSLRTEQNEWNVLSTASYSSSIDPASFYVYTVRTEGSSVKQYINSTLVISSDSISSHNTGGIGLQANFSVMKIDYVKVSILPGVPPAARFTEIAQPSTGVIGEICFTERAVSLSALNKAREAAVSPANLIFYVNSSLQVTNESFTSPYMTVQEAIAALDGRIMPTFYVSNAETVEKLCAYLNGKKIDDVFIMSADASLIRTARTLHKLCRGVLDFSAAYAGRTSVTRAELYDMHSATNTCGASVVTIPSGIASTENVKYLYDRLVAVWVNEPSPLTDVTRAFYLLSAGAHGIISSDAALLYTTARDYIGSSALLRTPLNVGHRGIPTQAPENTLEGAIMAYNAGADAIEVDVYLTADNEIVIIHDATTARTCNGNLNVEGSTLAQLKTLTANNQYPNDARFAGCRIPTLREYYEEFRGKDVQLFIEIKTQKPELAAYLKALTEQYGMQNQISVITFHAEQIKQMKSVFPQVSCGYLCAAVANGATGAKMAQSVLNLIQPVGSTYNPSYSGHTDAYIKNANMRGITTWPWTVNDNNTYNSMFASGYNGLTTDYANYAASYAKKLTSAAGAYTVRTGDSLTVDAALTRYDRSVSSVSQSVRVIVLEGADNVTVRDGNVLVFGRKSGTVTYALEYTNTNGANYKIFSQPVTVTVNAYASGDCNGDGAVNGKDLVRLKKYMANASTPIYPEPADLYGDGVINADDLARLVLLCRVK